MTMGYIAAVLALALSLVGGYFYVDSRAQARGYHNRDLECAAEKFAITSAKEEAERDARAQREKGRIVADRLATELADTRSALLTAQQRTAREISARASATRQCFSGSVARLLNAAPAVRAGGDPPSSAPAGTAATIAAPEPGPDGPGTSERAAADALNEARTGYSVCTTQLDRLIDWAKEVTSP